VRYGYKEREPGVLYCIDVEGIQAETKIKALLNLTTGALIYREDVPAKYIVATFDTETRALCKHQPKVWANAFNLAADRLLRWRKQMVANNQIEAKVWLQPEEIRSSGNTEPVREPVRPAVYRNEVAKTQVELTGLPRVASTSSLQGREAREKRRPVTPPEQLRQPAGKGKAIPTTPVELLRPPPCAAISYKGGFPQTPRESPRGYIELVVRVIPNQP
jgi:hypothetical protein